MKKSVFFLVLPVVLVWSACSIFSLKFEQRDLTITNLDGKTVPIRVELARSIRELAKGYMGRDNIPEGTGMLFILKKRRKIKFLDERYAYTSFDCVHQLEWRNPRDT